MRLTALDHAFIFADKGPSVAAREAVALAEGVEKLGYHRYWVSENHGPSSGCGSPEILVAAAAAATETIRVGTAAVLLPYYPPWKVATSFNLLSRLYGERIDLGIGRGAGADKLIAEQLKPVSEDSYDTQITALMEASGGDGVLLPEAPAPEMWLVSFSETGALTAARHGLAFCLGQFGHADLRPDLLKVYRDNFQPRMPGDEPTTGVCVMVACADDPDDAAALKTLIALMTNPNIKAPPRRSAHRGVGMPSWDELRAMAPVALPAHTYQSLTGTPSEVGRLLGDIVEAYQPDEIAVSTGCPDFELRLRTFEIVARLFETPHLTKSPSEALRSILPRSVTV